LIDSDQWRSLHVHGPSGTDEAVAGHFTGSRRDLFTADAGKGRKRSPQPGEEQGMTASHARLYQGLAQQGMLAMQGRVASMGFRTTISHGFWRRGPLCGLLS